jgi:hypothetical protein
MAANRRRAFTAKKLGDISVLTPLLTFLSAGLTKLVHWDVGGWGIALLIGFGVIGVALTAIPQKSYSWAVLPDTSWSTIKQTIATLRALVTVVLIAFPILILSTSRDFLDQLPKSLSNYIVHATADSSKNVLMLQIEQISPRASADTYAGTLVFQSQAASIGQKGESGILRSQGRISMTAKLYALNTSAIIHDITDNEILPFFYDIAFAALALSGVFVFAVFFMEIFADLLWEQNVRKPESV